jgi:hypothetical protein
MNESCRYTCPQHKGQVNRPRDNRTVASLNINSTMFDQNSISQTEAEKLVQLWTTQGLFNVLGLRCPECKSKKSAARLKKKQDPSPPLLKDVSTISFPGANPPAHLYFHLLMNRGDDQQQFVNEMNWPSKCSFLVQFTL